MILNYYMGLFRTNLNIKVITFVQEMKPTEQELIDQIKYAYTLAKALNAQYAWIREYHTPEVRKIISEAKAKNAHFVSVIERSLPPEEKEKQDEIGFRFLEEVYGNLK